MLKKEVESLESRGTVRVDLPGTEGEGVYFRNSTQLVKETMEGVLGYYSTRRGRGEQRPSRREQVC